MTIHSFNSSLEYSNRFTEAMWWLDIYRKAFPDLQSAVSVRQDGWAQRAGIDRVLTLASGRTITIDEKVREKDWSDILLEMWSDKAAKKKGWVASDLAIDFIAYAFVPSRRCFLLPFQNLRRAWRDNCFAWSERFKPHVLAENQQGGRRWTTESVAVPIDILLDAIRDSILISWGD